MKPHLTAPNAKQLAQVMLATLLVAGIPVAAVWWLRVSGTVDSVAVTLLVGMVLSLLTSWAGRVLWEKHQGSEDLLFSELMVWGYLHRRHAQRRLASAAELAAPLHTGTAGRDARAVREQTRLLGRLVAGMETRDPYLHGHSRRVARHSWMIARRMKLPAEEVARIRTAAALHDVGKTKTPKTILHKAGALTDEEYRIIKLHPGEGAEMSAVLGDPELVGMIRHHHERLDGSGYPDALSGEEIPLGARIIAVADTFDAITSARPYRAASPHRKAIDILHDEAGTRLDPDVVRAFCGHYAGRGPLALWSLVLSVPERLLSWLTAGAGTFATAAKVVAVAAIVGGAAATSATLGLAHSAHRPHPRASQAPASPAAVAGGSRAPETRAPSAAHAAPTGQPRATPRGAHARRHASHAPAGASLTAASAPAGAGAAAPAGQSPAAPQSAADAKGTHQEAGSGSGSGPEEARHVERGHRPVASEAPGAAHEEAVVKGRREEAPGHSKAEEPVSHGRSEEAPGHSKAEEPVSHGNSEEAPGHSKAEEPVSHGRSEEAAGKGSSGSQSSGNGNGSSGHGSSGKAEAAAGGTSGEAG